MVGALIVEGGEVVAEGFHQKCGGLMPKSWPSILWGANHLLMHLYLFPSEPCSTHGKTPPCTDAILNSGIQSVYVAGLDPNPLHAGNGIEILREKGLKVELSDSDFQKKSRTPQFHFQSQHANRTALDCPETGRIHQP